MEKVKNQSLTIFFLVAFTGSCLMVPSSEHAMEPSSLPQNPLLGCWRSNSGHLIRFGVDWALVFERGKGLQFYCADYCVDTKANQKLSVRLSFPYVDTTVRLQLKDNILSTEEDGEQDEILPKSPFHKLILVPRELKLAPLQVAKTKPLAQVKIKKIQDELERRLAIDQEIRNDGVENASQKDHENIKYIIEIIQEIGWIDVDRFGEHAANIALLLAHHSGDVTLMMAGFLGIHKQIKQGKLAAPPAPPEAPALYEWYTSRFQKLIGDRDKAKKTTDFRHGLSSLQRMVSEGIQSGNPKPALQAMAKAIVRDPWLKPRLIIPKLRLLLSQGGNSKKALRYGTKLLQTTYKQDAGGLRDMADAIVSPDAKKPSDKLIQLARESAHVADALAKEQDASIADTLARVYFVSGDVIKAVEIQERAVRLASELVVDDDNESAIFLEKLRKHLGGYKKASQKP